MMRGMLSGMTLSTHTEPLDMGTWEGPAQWSTEELYGTAWAVQGRLEVGAAIKLAVPTKADLERLLKALDGVKPKALRRLFIVPTGGLRVG